MKEGESQNYQDKYDELDNIISSIDILVDEISDKDYIDRLNEIKFDAQNEKEEVGEKLEKEREEEEKQQALEYERSVL